MTVTVTTNSPETTGGTTAAVRATGLTKVYGRGENAVFALDDVSVAIEKSAFTAVMGPSGSGKSTLVQVLSGLDTPTSGSVHLGDTDITTLKDKALTAVRRDRIGFVFQQFNLVPTLTAAENITLPSRLAGRKVDPQVLAEIVDVVGLAGRLSHRPAELSGGQQQRVAIARALITQQVGQMLEIVDLAGREQRRPRELSGGQQQRVALARALVNHPKALLLDEPLGALDLKLRQAMQVELKRIQREVGITFVYVTHDQNEALTMSDRIAVMNDGVIEQLGPPREIYEHPKTRFVAGFIGTSNLITGTLSRVTDGIGVIEVSPDEHILVPAAHGDLAAGQDVELTVRPEKMDLATGPGAPGSCALRGKVAEVVYLGTSTSFSIHTTTGADVVVFEQNSSSASSTVSRGDDVWLTWDPQHSYPMG